MSDFEHTQEADFLSALGGSKVYYSIAQLETETLGLTDIIEFHRYVYSRKYTMRNKESPPIPYSDLVDRAVKKGWKVNN